MLPRKLVCLHQGLQAHTIAQIIRKRNLPPPYMVFVSKNTFHLDHLHKDFHNDHFGQKRHELPLAVESAFPHDIITLKEYAGFSRDYQKFDNFIE